MKKQPSQKIVVLKHLLRYGSITDKRARDSYGITRLAARIDNLSEAAWRKWWDGSGTMGDPRIVAEMVKFKTRLGRSGRYAKYVIIDPAAWREAFKHELEA